MNKYDNEADSLCHIDTASNRIQMIDWLISILRLVGSMSFIFMIKTC
jgi:hypothetical protein